MSQPPRGSSTRVHPGKPPAPPDRGADGSPSEDPTPEAGRTSPGFRAALVIWAVAFAALALYEVSLLLVKLAF